MFQTMCLRCHKKMSRRLLDIVAVAIFLYSLRLYMSVPSAHELERVARGEFGYRRQQTAAINHGRADDFNQSLKIVEEQFEIFDGDVDVKSSNVDVGGNPHLPTDISAAQKQLNYIADNIQITLHLAEGTNKIIASLINMGSESILPSTWYIVLCHSPALLRLKNHHPVANGRLVLNRVEGNIFILRPTKWFKSLDTGERLEFTLGMLMTGSDYFANWYVTAPGLMPRVILSTAQGQFHLDVSRAVDKSFTPLQRYQQNINTNLLKLDGRRIHAIPTPHTVTYKHGKQAVYSIGLWSEWSIMYTSDVRNEAEYLSKKLGNLSFAFDREKKFIEMTTGEVSTQTKLEKKMREQAYQLSFRPNQQSITIIGVTRVGVLYGIQTLLGLLSHKGQLITDLPEFNIIDYPRLAYRGLMLDTARSFIRKQEVLRTLEVMSMYKLNVLHLHLSDDQGWRLEIPGLKELTEVGSRRLDDMEEGKGLRPYLGAGPHGNTYGSGYYSVRDYQEILQFANNRHIKVIPEIDMPGHAHAAIISMRSRSRKLEKLAQPEAAWKYALSDPDDKSKYTAINGYKLTTVNPCMSSTFTFLEHVISAIKEMHKDIQPLTTFHLGGDEVPDDALTRSPICVAFRQKHPELTTTRHIKQYFMMKASDLLRRMNLSMQIWEDGLFDTAASSINAAYESIQNIRAQIWKRGNKERIINLAKQGYKLIMSEAQHVYFDHKNEPHIAERGFQWAASYINVKTVFMYSGVGQLKKVDSELAKRIIGIEGALWGETIQTRSHFHNMLYPRLLALAERAWHEAPWELTDVHHSDPNLNKDWNYFANILSQKELYRLEWMSIDYYIPPPGISTTGRTAYVNTALPDLRVDMSTDGGFTWRMFQNGSEIPDGRLFFTTRSMDGKRMSRTVNILHEAKNAES